ncbi:hypothetical protein ACOSP7_024044 [Xanthoceras sorbifolium]
MTTTNTRPSSDEDDSAKVGVGQGELYSPPYAIQLIPTNKQQQLQQDTIAKMVIRLVTIKEKVLEKLASAPVPADALDTARHFLETVVRDFIVAAHGLTKDALLRINTHLVPLLPSLSPNITRKMVDDAEEEANIESDEKEGEEEKEEINNSKAKSPYVSPTSSLFASHVKPLSRL